MDVFQENISFDRIVKYLVQHFGDTLVTESEILLWISNENDNKLAIEKLQRNLNQYLHKYKQLKPDLDEIYLESYIMSIVYEIVISKLFEIFHNNDKTIYKQCLELGNFSNCKNNFDNISLPAAVVELASLDSHKTPREKANCLCTCFDLIFAELKMALVEVIAERETNTIPIINNSDLLPVIMNVIVQAKPQHFYSNLFYLHTFGTNLLGNTEFKNVLMHFENAIEELIHDRYCYFKDKNLMKELDIYSYYKVSSHTNNINNDNLLFENSTKRYCYLISLSHQEMNK